MLFSWSSWGSKLMIGTDHTLFIYIRLQCFLLFNHERAGMFLRNLWLLEIDEWTLPFSCRVL